MATKTASANNQTLVADVATDTYSSGGFSGVTLDFSDVAAHDLTLVLADPVPTPVTGAGDVSFGATDVALTLDRITAVKGTPGDDYISYTSSATRSSTAYTVYASEGNDAYDLYGNSTLSYASYGHALTVDVTSGSVTGKLGGKSDILGSFVEPNKLVLTSLDDTVILDNGTGKTLNLVDGGGHGTSGNTLSWDNGDPTSGFNTLGVAVDLDHSTDDAGNNFTNFQNYIGSQKDDLFTASAVGTTGYTLLSSEGNDFYSLNSGGTVSYANYSIASGTRGLTFDLDGGAVTGKAGGKSDGFSGVTGNLVGTNYNDTFIASTTAGNVLTMLDGGAGTDLLSFASVAHATVDLDAHTATGISGTFSHIEQFLGSAGNDSFTDSAVTGFTIFASAGSDVYALSGNGTLSYAGNNYALTVNLVVGSVAGKGAGGDVITGLAPSIIGSDGNDQFYAKGTGNETLDGGLGNDVLHLTGTEASYFFTNNNDGSGLLTHSGQTIAFSHFETLVFSDVTTTLTAAPQDDFFGLGRSATFWRASGGDVWIWNNHGTSADAYTHNVGQVDPVWEVVGIGDVAGDGKSDVMFHNTTNGEVYLWNMNGGSIATQGDVTSLGLPVFLDPAVWHGLGMRDFDGDGKADVLWETNTGLVYEWSMNGSNIISQGTVGQAPADVALGGGGTSSYSVLGFGDVNGDGKQDVVWYDAAAGAIEFWYMNGSSHTVKDISFTPSLHVDGVGDFNGDGVADLVGHDASGNFAIAALGKDSSGVGTGSIVSLNVITTIDPTVWSIKQVADYNGDGHADILFTSTAGDVYVWEMNGNSIIAQGSAGHIDVSAHWTLYS